jgi:hypothetical protein
MGSPPARRTFQRIQRRVAGGMGDPEDNHHEPHRFLQEAIPDKAGRYRAAAPEVVSNGFFVICLRAT